MPVSYTHLDVYKRQESKRVTLLDTLNFVSDAWKIVHPRIIANWSRKAGFNKVKNLI